MGQGLSEARASESLSEVGGVGGRVPHQIRRTCMHARVLIGISSVGGAERIGGRGGSVQGGGRNVKRKDTMSIGG